MSETAKTTEVKENKPIPKKKKPRQPKRSMEELYTLPENKLSETEKIRLIRKLKEELTLSDNKFKEAHNVVTSAFEQNRQLEEQIKSMEQFYGEQFKYINQQVNSFHAAINKVTKGA